MKIKLEDVISKGWTVEVIGKNHAKVFYKNTGRGNNPKPFVFPMEIELNEFVSECIGLYLGDGKLSADVCHAAFTNKDMDLSYKIFMFFKFFGVRENDITFTISYRSGNKEKISGEISDVIGKQNFKFNKNDRIRYPSLTMQVNGTIFRIVLENLIKSSLNTIRSSTNLRRAWLRGYFAAEGCVGYHSKENYLANVSFSYNPKKEVWLRDYCLEILRIEGIDNNVNIRHEENNGAIIINNWKNYYKLWKIGLFNGCERKKLSFENSISKVKICCKLYDTFRDKLFSNLNQYKLAKILSTHQATISNMANGTDRNMWPTIEQLIKLCKINKISLEEAKKNISLIRFGNLTIVQSSNEMLDDVFNLRNLSS